MSSKHRDRKRSGNGEKSREGDSESFCVRDLVFRRGNLSLACLLLLAWTSTQPQFYPGNPAPVGPRASKISFEPVDVPDASSESTGRELPGKKFASKMSGNRSSGDPSSGTCDLKSVTLESCTQESGFYRFQIRHLLHSEENLDNDAIESLFVAESSTRAERSVRPSGVPPTFSQRNPYRFNQSPRMSRPAYFNMPMRRSQPIVVVPHQERSTRDGDPMFMRRPYFRQSFPVYYSPRSAVLVETQSDQDVQKFIELIVHPKTLPSTGELVQTPASESKELDAAPQLETLAKSTQVNDDSASKEAKLKENEEKARKKLKLVSKLMEALPKIDKEVLKLLKPADIPVILNKMAELERVQLEAADQGSSALVDGTESKSEVKDPSSSPAAEKDESKGIGESKSTRETLGSLQKSLEALDLSSNSIHRPSVESDSQVRQQTGNCGPGTCTCKDIVSFMGDRIPREAPRVCDGRCDCPDCSDERDQCAVNFADRKPTFSTSCFGAAPSECTQCRVNERSCTDVESVPDRFCYSQVQECDGVRDCPNSGKDETGCLLLDTAWPSPTSVPLKPKGYLFRKIQGVWTFVCTGYMQEAPVDLAREVCSATVGRFSSAQPTVKEVAQNSMGSFDAVLRAGVRVVRRACVGFHVRVESPSPTCGSRSRAAAGTKASLGEGSPQKTDAVRIAAKQPQEESAGVYTETNEDDDRIIGGTSVAEKDFPWIVAIKATMPTGGWGSCSGFIFNPQWVVTAAHCFFSYDNNGQLVNRYQNDHFQIMAGLVRLLSASPSTQIRHGVLAVVHEAYTGRPQNPQPPDLFLNDLAMIKVNTPFIFNVYVNALCPPPTNTRAPTGFKCFLRGWGFMRQGVPTADHLQGISVRIHEPCTAWNAALRNPDKQICATTRDVTKGACNGDSGGPLVCQTSQGFVAEGIVSYGQQGCAQPHNPTAFTKVSTYLDWISKNIAKEATGAFNKPEYLLGRCSGMLCDDGRCLAKAQICNGVYDCPVHGEDERNCPPPRRIGRFSPFL